MEEVILGVISDGAIVDNTKQNELMQMAIQLIIKLYLIENKEVTLLV